MGSLSNKFTADLQRVNEEMDATRKTMTADITRTPYKHAVCWTKLFSVRQK